jgi:hypothetical protein
MNVYASATSMPMFPSGDDGPSHQTHTHAPSPLELAPEKFSDTGIKLARTFITSYLPLLEAE